MNLEDIRSELQLTSEVISDADVNYVISKLESDSDNNLICAEVLRLVLRKHKGLVERRIGKYWEVIDPMHIKKEINKYMNKAASSVFDDEIAHPDAIFTREGL